MVIADNDVANGVSQAAMHRAWDDLVKMLEGTHAVYRTKHNQRYFTTEQAQAIRDYWQMQCRFFGFEGNFRPSTLDYEEGYHSLTELAEMTGAALSNLSNLANGTYYVSDKLTTSANFARMDHEERRRRIAICYLMSSTRNRACSFLSERTGVPVTLIYEMRQLMALPQQMNPKMHKQRAFRRKRIDQAATLHAKGLTPKEIGAVMGMTADYTTKLLHQHSIEQWLGYIPTQTTHLSNALAIFDRLMLSKWDYRSTLDA